MSLETQLHRNRGVMRAARLLEQGWSQRTLAHAVQSERLIRPARGWIALPSADPQLLFAARHGAVLSCVTQAQRLGLWVLREPQPHLAAPRRGTNPDRGGCVIHWGTPLRARLPYELEDPIENVLGHIANCQPHEAALVVWDSALNQQLIDKPTLARFSLSPRARALLAASSSVADSGLETLMRSRLRFLRVRILAQAWILGHRVDFLLGERLVMQIDGAHHVGPQRSADIRHDAELQLRGYTVIRVSYQHVIDDWPAVQDIVMRAIAQGLHLAQG